MEVAFKLINIWLRFRSQKLYLRLYENENFSFSSNKSDRFLIKYTSQINLGASRNLTSCTIGSGDNIVLRRPITLP